jgi:hypothetical protein
MFNNVALDVFIGLIFIFLLYSLMATIIQEMIATRLAFRAKVLEKAILRMLEDGKSNSKSPFVDRINGFLHLLGLKNLLKGKSITPWFYAHPLIKYLSEDNYFSKPSYLNAANFSKVMIDLLKGFDQPESQAIQSIHNSITAGTIHKLPISISTSESDGANPAIKILQTQYPEPPGPGSKYVATVQINPNTAFFLRSLWRDSGADINIFRKKLEQWFDDTMLRASGWYKRYTKIVLLIVGFIVAYAFNVDTIAIHRILSKDKGAREQLVNLAIRDNGKYSGTVQQMRSGDSTTLSDTILRNTYDMVDNDANMANSILGLGKPWKDTCKICRDSLNPKPDTGDTFLRRLAVLVNKRDTIRQLQDTLFYYQQMKAELIAVPVADKKRLGFIDSIIVMRAGFLNAYDTDAVNRGYQKMVALKARCEYINRKVAGKWNYYSPNQNGGWETFFGWLITAMAITLGAPFWFDLLSKLISLRGSAGNTNTSNDPNTNSNVPPPSGAPVNINVNTNQGGEAVG